MFCFDAAFSYRKGIQTTENLLELHKKSAVGAFVLFQPEFIVLKPRARNILFLKISALGSPKSMGNFGDRKIGNKKF